MPVKRRRVEQSEATRAALLRVARRLFAERGYAATGIEEVARKARVTRGALYHHFRDKHDLFTAVLMDEERKLTERIARAAVGQGDPWASLVAGCEAFLDACLDPAVQRIILTDAPSVLGSERWREIDAEYGLRLLREALNAASAAGVIRPAPIEPLAHILLGALNEAAMLTAHTPGARAEVGRSVMSLLSGLRVPPQRET
jgi:AcrR family transcriptional regulator